ncbi:hypothetical protein [Streptosporangium sp. NPDC023615]|uniref:hypothetical protein n=1 Tax=Streptosporangium sp. NPDC023615 TaxID=3154794 RepID=UPI0034305170
MMNRPLVLLVALMCMLPLSAACQNEEATPIDRTPLPALAAPPYICEHIPLKAVELMTGTRNPLVRGHFNLTSDDIPNTGVCVVRRRTDQENVLVIDLSSGNDRAAIQEYLDDGAAPLPGIVAGAIGAYSRPKNSENNSAYAHLVRGETRVSVQLEIGVEGRDNAADVAAMMKLIAPKLLTQTTAPSASPSAKADSPVKD